MSPLDDTQSTDPTMRANIPAHLTTRPSVTDDPRVARALQLHPNERVLTGCEYCRAGDLGSDGTCTPPGEQWQCEGCGWRGDEKCPTVRALTEEADRG